MERTDVRVGLGLLLVGTGILLLLQNLGVLPVAGSIVWALLFAAGGVAFLLMFVGNRDRWWASIPGFTLLGLGALLGLESANPYLARVWGGSLFLGGIGVGFLASYIARREHWWAIIPGGVLLTLALVAGLEQILRGAETGGIFFFGLAVTFGLVYLLPTPRGRMNWALIPATVLFVLGLLTTAAAASAVNYLWSVILILAGLFLVYRSLRLQQR